MRLCLASDPLSLMVDPGASVTQLEIYRRWENLGGEERLAAYQSHHTCYMVTWLVVKLDNIHASCPGRDYHI
jgi:hypothetical protein